MVQSFLKNQLLDEHTIYYKKENPLTLAGFYSLIKKLNYCNTKIPESSIFRPFLIVLALN